MNCKQCGAPLKKGNIQVVRPRGKKRPYRVCRRCPDPNPSMKAADLARSKSVHYPPPSVIAEYLDPKPEVFGGTAGDGLQRPQDTAGGPFVVEGVFTYSEPPRYRFFMTRDQAEKVKASVERNAAFGFGLAFEVIPVPDYQVDQDPDRFADMVEVTLNGYNGESE